MGTQRQSTDTWVTAGLEALVTEGPEALRAERLARRLKTTKGSFYWHFEDVAAFHNTLLETWKTSIVAAMSETLDADQLPQSQLLQLARVVLADQQGQALRAWAPTHRKCAETLADVDGQRRAHIQNLLQQLDTGNPAFAAACDNALIGGSLLTGTVPPLDAFDALIDLVLALK